MLTVREYWVKDDLPRASATMKPVAGTNRQRAVAQFGSAPGWGPGGRRFKSCQPDMEETPIEDASLEGPPFSEEEYAALAKRYRETGGRTPTSPERVDFASARIVRLRARPGAEARSEKIRAEMTEADHAYAEAVEALAFAFAKRRWGSTVHMDGSTNPTPADFQEAKFFIQALLGAGWIPPNQGGNS